MQTVVVDLLLLRHPSSFGSLSLDLTYADLIHTRATPKRMASNYHRVESPADLQAQLSADLNRVSVLYFRADWAEPCKTMDAVTHELANRSPDVLFLSVRARRRPLTVSSHFG